MFLLNIIGATEFVEKEIIKSRLLYLLPHTQDKGPH